jgi:hypothetical protein
MLLCATEKHSTGVEKQASVVAPLTTSITPESIDIDLIVFLLRFSSTQSLTL